MSTYQTMRDWADRARQLEAERNAAVANALAEQLRREKAEGSAADDFRLRAAADAKADSDADYIRRLEARVSAVTERAEKAEEQRDRARGLASKCHAISCPARRDPSLECSCEVAAALADEPPKPPTIAERLEPILQEYDGAFRALADEPPGEP